MIVLLSPYPPPHISGVIQFGGGGELWGRALNIVLGNCQNITFSLLSWEIKMAQG